MSAVPPPWIDPGVRLIEADTHLGWPDIAAAADALEATFRRESGMATVGIATVEGDRASTVAAALIAAERANVPLFLKRHGPNPGAPVAEDATPAMPGFAVLLETSGTTGAPKRARHGFDRLRGRLRGAPDPDARWLLTFEPASFAGLQVILTALASGGTLVSVPGGGAAELAQAALRHAVTHVSATPSFWRAFLMALGNAGPPLASVTLGGEAVDQPLLDRLAARFPGAKLRHIYASTEAGALFAVTDGRAGFPASWLETGVDGVALRLCDGVLEVRSPRAMTGYAGPGGGAPDADGWLSTGDVVEVRGDRALFAGRLDGRVNVGGVKVSPEAVEQRLLGVPDVQDALVRAAANPITGHILTATVVPAPGVTEADVRAAVREAIADLPPAARPRVITLADHIPLGSAGKKTREGAA
ncbi:ANL family adenylate-forming protein [Azospirillum rugosum]|uniref:Long-chain-fatty-acid--CoA ligase n=1 Tax=Azospirillum rugosum TaxID=416170 RepID=A0ABS4SPL4_9PROT|nr:fatty acid--CoA ligase family protein [Azospirillum rugosum]MBP2294486.1 acyl-coenzyme A synthetase/AMP-(fatty) acid ligase [Azospirillum rugosum]MDQ0528991.1 acyl-coenzyme A synthetase/AMP-(fatty) acid ligase [Azospirillum rugosum]